MLTLVVVVWHSTLKYFDDFPTFIELDVESTINGSCGDNLSARYSNVITCPGQIILVPAGNEYCETCYISINKTGITISSLAPQ
jgi:hypothetical protein